MVLAYRNHWYRDTEIFRKWKGCEIPHDLMICALAAEARGFGQMDRDLAWHRRHDSNAGGEEHRIRRLLDKKRKLEEIDVYLTNLERFLRGHYLKKESAIGAVQEKYASMKGRKDALMSGKFSRVIRNAKENTGRVRLATLVCDLLIVKR